MISLAAIKAAWSTRKFWVSAIVVIVVLALIGGAFLYVNHLSSKVTRLTGERDTALAGMMQAKAEKAELERSVERAERNIEHTNLELAEARDEAQRYQKKFEDHDLAKLATAKPGLVTRFARRATERVLNDIEAAINQTSDRLPEPAGNRSGTASAASADGFGS